MTVLSGVYIVSCTFGIAKSNTLFWIAVHSSINQSTIPNYKVNLFFVYRAFYNTETFRWPNRALEDENLRNEERDKEEERKKTKQRLIDIAEARKKKASPIPSAGLAMVAGLGGGKVNYDFTGSSLQYNYRCFISSEAYFCKK